MEFEKYKYEVRALMLRMAKLTVEAAANEDIKKEPQIRQDFFEGRCKTSLQRRKNFVRAKTAPAK